jgi:hypothetical protein
MLWRRRVKRFARDPAPRHLTGYCDGVPALFLNTAALMLKLGYCVTQK